MYKGEIQYANLDLSEMEGSFFLTGLLSEFVNRFQAAGDCFIEEISWKQCFTIICIGLFEQPPTLRELSEVMGSSHQNVKQMLLKLEREGYVCFAQDKSDKRKQRIIATEKAEQLSEKYDLPSQRFMEQLFANISDEDVKVTIQTIIKLDVQLKVIAEKLKENGVNEFRI